MAGKLLWLAVHVQGVADREFDANNADALAECGEALFVQAHPPHSLALNLVTVGKHGGGERLPFIAGATGTHVERLKIAVAGRRPGPPRGHKFMEQLTLGDGCLRLGKLLAREPQFHALEARGSEV